MERDTNSELNNHPKALSMNSNSHSQNESTMSPEPSYQTGAPSKEELLRKLDEADEYMARDETLAPEGWHAWRCASQVIQTLIYQNAQLKQDIKTLQRQAGGWS